MLKQDLKLQIMNYTDHYVKEKAEKVIWLMKYDLSGKLMTEFAVNAKTCS